MYNYTLEHRIIRNPGRYEGEIYYIPIYWEMVLDGSADNEYIDDNNNLIAVFHIGRDDINSYPELSDTLRLELWQSEDGFIYSNHITLGE
jgi:hypothetical protein